MKVPAWRGIPERIREHPDDVFDGVFRWMNSSIHPDGITHHFAAEGGGEIVFDLAPYERVEVFYKDRVPGRSLVRGFGPKAEVRR